MRALVLSLLMLTPVHAAEVAFLVRHAEKQNASADAPLSKAGQARAQALAKTLKDAGITSIFVTQYRRTQETAAPLAKALGLVPKVIPSGDVPGLVRAIEAAPGRVLVVGHVDTIPQVLLALSHQSVQLRDADYDNLFEVAAGKLIRLHY